MSVKHLFCCLFVCLYGSFVELQIDPRALHMIGKCSTIEIQPIEMENICGVAGNVPVLNM